jgi:hypothetical protein
MLLILAQNAGTLLANILKAKGMTGAGNMVQQAETAVRLTIGAIKQNAPELSGGELTGEDVQKAVLAAMASVDQLIAEAEASLASRRR